MSTPTAGGDSNLDNIIKKNFPTEIQQRRVKLELKYLKELDQNCYKISLQSSPLGLKIIVSLTKDFILGQLPESKKFQHPIMFEFLLEPKFPFVFPKLLCKTNITTPSLADGRDFVYDVIQRMWNPSIMLRDVVTFIPDFLKKIDELQVPEETQTMGSYYLGHLYNLEDFLTMESVQVFSAKEMINEQSTNNERFLVLSESYFLNFESVDKVRNTLRLIGWAHVHAIFKIKRNKDDHKMIVVLWRDFNNKGILIQNVFIMEESTQFIEAFIRQSTKYADISDAIRKKRDLPLSEVTARSYENMDIEQLLETIEILESKLEEELDIDTINLLMNLYQKAVEYFSALNDETYSIFMEKLHVLLTREDIQVVLKSGESMPVKKPQSPQKSPQKKPEPKTQPQKQEQEAAISQPVVQVQEVKKEEAPKPVEQKVQEVEAPVQKKEEPKPLEEKLVQEEVKPKEEPKAAEKKEEVVEKKEEVVEKKEEPVVVEPEPVQKEEEKPKESEPEVKQAEPEQKEEEKAPEVSEPETKEVEKVEEPKAEEAQSKKSKKKNKKGKAAAEEEPKAEETQAEEAKVEEIEPEEPKAEEPKVEEQKPEETRPEEPQVEETKPEEVQEETKPEEPKAEEQKPEETQPEEPKVEEQKPEEVQPAEEAKVEETQAAEEPKAEEPQIEESKPEEPQEEAKPEEPKAEEAQPEENKPEEVQEETKPQEAQPEEPKVEEEKPEETKPEEPKAEEPKVEEKKEEEETTHANVAIANNDDMFDIGDDDDD